MTWVAAVVVVAVLATVAVVATGRGGELAPAYDDRRDVRVQADGPLTADDLEQVRFTTALRGYRATPFDFRVWWVRDYPAGRNLGNYFRYVTQRETWNPTGGMPEWLYVRRVVSAGG